jgi:hypothetical protein
MVQVVMLVGKRVKKKKKKDKPRSSPDLGDGVPDS